MLNRNKKLTMQPLLVLLYTLLYIALLGLVIQPIPLGALTPRLWRMIRLTEVRAAIRLLIDGMRNPNFIDIVLKISLTNNCISHIHQNFSTYQKNIDFND